MSYPPHTRSNVLSEVDGLQPKPVQLETPVSSTDEPKIQVQSDDEAIKKEVTLPPTPPLDTPVASSTDALTDAPTDVLTDALTDATESVRIESAPVASQPSVQSPVVDNPLIPQSALLSEWNIRNQTLLFGLNFKQTLTPKKGLINRMRGKTQEMDIDLSCILYDSRCEVVDVIWFKNLRTQDSAIRHHGDSLNGTDRGDAAKIDKNIDMEQIELRLTRLSPKVEHIALVMSSYYGQPFASIERGNLSLRDDEDDGVLAFDLKHLDKDCHAMWVAGLSREMSEWRLTTHKLKLDDHNMKAMTVQISNELARSRMG